MAQYALPFSVPFSESLTQGGNLQKALRGKRMNKIYQVLWSKTRHMYVVVSEIATRNTKAPGTKTLLGARLAAAALVLAVGIGQGLAYAEDKTVDIGNGGTATYTEKGNVVIGKDNTVPNDGAGKNVVTGTGNSAQHVDGTGNAQKFLPDDPKLVDDNNGNPSPVETPGNTKGLDSAVISGNGASAEADGDTSIGKGANITNPLVPYYADDPYYKHTYETTVTILHPDGTIERKKLDPMTVINQDPSASPTSYNTTKDDEGNIITTKVKETETPTRNLADGYSYYSQSFYDPSTDSLAAGTDATVTGKDAVAAGHDSQAAGNSVAVGNKASSEEGGTAVGPAAAAGTGAVATGIGANADNFGVASGASSNAGENAVAVGDGSYAGDSSQAIGSSSQATNDSTAVGKDSRADWNSIAVGNNSSATGVGSAALGNNTSVIADGGVALGEGSVADTPAENYGWDPVTKTQATAADKGTDPVWFSNRGAVSVGTSTVDSEGNIVPVESRQITNVAAGTNDGDAVNVAQLKSAVTAAEGHYYSWNDKDDHQPNYKNDGATGNRALAAGVGAAAAGDGATSVGNYTNASGETSIAIGGTKQNDDGTISYVQTPKMVQKIDPDTNQPVVDSNGKPVMVEATDADGNVIYVNKLDDNGNPIPYNTEAYGQDSIAIGTDAKAWADRGIAVGMDSQATKEGAAFGYKSNVYGQDGTAVGTQSGAATNATAVGISTSAYGESATAVGKGSGAASNATAVGTSASAWGDSATAVGQKSGAGYNSAAVGYQASAYGSSAAAVGNGAGAGNYGTAVGNYAGGTGQYATGVGYKASGSSSESTAVGNNVTASGSNTTTVGNYSSAGGSNSTAVGSYSGASNSNSTAVGYHATANYGSGWGGATSVGYYADSNGEGSTSLGYYSNSGYQATAVGYYANATYQSATAVGHALANSYSATGVGDGAKANGTQSTAVGYSTNAGYEATAVGYYANASDSYATAVGYNANANSSNSTAVGHAYASSSNATAVGESAYATSSSDTAVGNWTHASGSYSTAIGNSAAASSYESTAAGYNAHASNSYATAIGNSASASSQYSTAVGYASASNDYATAVGHSANAHGYQGTALGYNANASGYQASALGYSANASGSSATAVGYGSGASGSNTTAIGYGAGATDGQTTAIGYQASSSGGNTLAVGFQAGATGGQTTSIGYHTSASGSNTTAIGYKSAATDDSTTAIGNQAKASNQYSTAIGYNNQAVAQSATAIGNASNAWGTNAVAISTSAGAGNDAVAIGNAAGAYGDDSVAISSGASAGKYAVSVGKNANAWKEDSIVFGYNSKSGSDHGIMGWDPLSANIGQDYTTPTWTSTNNAVSFGRAEERDADGNVTLTQITRQINNVAAGTLDTDVVNVAQLKSAIKSFEYNAGKWHDYDVNVPTEEITADTNYDNTGAQKGKRAMAAGFSATANGDDSMALGFATANGVESVAIGKGAVVDGVKAVGAFGQGNTAGKPADENGAYTLQYNGTDKKETVMADADMHEAYTDGGKTFNVTFKTEDKADQHLLVLRTKDNTPVVLASDGKLYNVSWDNDSNSYVQGDEATGLTTANLVTHAYGTDGATFVGAYSTAFGHGNTASGTASLAFGGEPISIKKDRIYTNTASGKNSVAFGAGTVASGQDTVAFGDGSTASNDEAVAFGQRTTASAARATAFGESSTASGQTATAFGYHTTASGTGATALGNKSQASGMYAMAWGGGDRHVKDAQGNELKDDQGNPVKLGPVASGTYSTAFGSGTQATAENATAFGELSNATGKNSTAFGKESTASGENTLAALGGTAEGANSTAIGVGATAKLDGSIALGDGAVANTAAGKVGYDALGTGYVSTDQSAAWKSTKNALSVGDVDNKVTRQITGLAAGSEDTDAVNVAQLKRVTTLAEQHTLVTVNQTKTEAPKDATTGKYTDEYDTENGNLNIRASTGENGQNTFNIKLNDQIGLGQKGEPGTPGKDGVDGKVTVVEKDGSTIIIGKDGEDGAPGIAINGKDGKDGNNGKDAVSITAKDGKDGVNGKDGHIGMTGTRGIDGKDGAPGTDGKVVYADIQVRNGHNGVDGTDGKDGTDGMTRIVYEDNNKVIHEVATLDDGMKYGANIASAADWNNPVYNKLNTIVNVKGGADNTDGYKEIVKDGMTDAEKLAAVKTKYSGQNVLTTVEQDAQTGTTTIKVLLDKDLQEDTINVGGKDGENGKDGKDGVDGKIGVQGKNGKDGVTITARGEDGEDGAVGAIGLKGEDGKDGIGLNGKDGISMQGEAGKNGISIKGDPGLDGKPGKDGISIKGPQGDPGEPGNNGHIGISGKDGKDAVAINGTDGIGTIGLAGKDGTKGADGKDGIGITTIRTEYVTRPGVDGEDGEDGVTRIIYKDPEGGEHDVATLDDGLKFTGNNSTAINHNKLDTTVHVVGEGTGSDLTTFKSAGGNIAVEANDEDDDKSTLTVKLNKDVNLGSDGSLTVGGNGTNNDSIVIKNQTVNLINKDGDYTQITQTGDYILGLDNRTWNVTNPTYVSGRAATEDELKQAGDQIIKNITNTTENGGTGGFGLEDEVTGQVSQNLGTNIKVIGDGTRTKDDATGKVTITDSNIITRVKNVEDGTKAVKISLSDNVNVGGNDGKDGHIGVNGKDGRNGTNGKDAVSINAIGKDGETGADGQIGVNGKDGTSIIIGKDAVPGADGKDGLNGISIKGEDGADGKSGVTIVGPQGQNGRDGYDGIDGKIGISGKDGKDAVSISGKDGIGQIGLTGKDGAPGADGTQKTITTTISTLGPNGTNGKDGIPGVDGKPGEPGITRIQYNDGTNTQTVATLNDGLKFTGNNSDKVNHNKLDTTVHIVGEGTDKDLSKFQSAGGNIAVEANGGSDNDSTLTIKLNKDVNLGGNGSLTVGGDTKNGDSIVVKNYGEGDLTDNKDGKVEGGDYITGLDNRTWNIDDPTYVSGRAATEDELKLAGDQINTKIDNVEQKITNITEADKGGGFGLADDTGKKVSQDLGTNISIIGDGTRTYENGKVKVTDSNITTEVVPLGDGTHDAVQVSLSDHVNLGGKGKDGKDGVDGSIGINGKDGKSGVGIDGKDGISMTGEAGKNGISIKGDSGKDGKDGISIKGPSGKDGDNGHIGISGKDGKDAVALDGKDGVGHIGLKGEPGKDGKDATADITVHQGPVGVDGTNGKDGKDGMDRITYVDHNEVIHEVATLDDGLKFGANAASKNYKDNPVYNKLNSTIDIVGEGTKDESAYSGQNIKTFVKQDDGNTTITVKLDKDLQEDTINVGGKDGKDGVDGKIGVQGKNGKDGVTITAKGEDGKDGAVGDIGIKGEDGKDGIGLNGKDGISMQGEAGKNGISIKGDPGEDGKPGKDGISIKGPSGKDGDNGHIGISGKDGKDAVAIDGKNGVGTIGLAGKDGKDGISTTTIRTEYTNKPGVDGKDGKDGLTRIIYTDPDGKDHPVATTDDGMKFVGEDGTATPISKKLNETLQIRGDGTYDASTQKVTKQGNIITSVDQGTIKVELNKDLKDLNSVTSKTYYAGDTTTDNYTTINKDGMTIKNGPTITKTNVDMNNQQIHHVAPGTEGTDAVNVNQLKGSINKVDNRINKAAAGAAALSALHPLDFDPDDKWDFAAGYGHYKDANAAAIGAFYRPNEDTMFSVGASMGNGENMINAGVSVKLGQGNHVSVSRVAMAKEIIELRKELENVKSYLADQAAGNTLDLSKIQLFPDTPENHWAYDYVATMAGNGVLEGYPDGYFKGNRNMTRYEMAAVLYRMMQNGAKLSERALREFAPELDRIRVDTITKDKRGVPDIQRVRTVKGRE